MYNVSTGLSIFLAIIKLETICENSNVSEETKMKRDIIKKAAVFAAFLLSF